MCGINGILTSEMRFKEKIESTILEMNDSIFHRGPDDEGVFTNHSPKYSLGMGMRRLSIIDLHSGKQPIYNNDKSIVIVFNGEIYNYKILRLELEAENVIFDTKTDTEVILKLYEKFGVESFNRLDGMFAFSIYDMNLDKLFIARDFFGEKPLYYYKNDTCFYWASELKSIIISLPSKPNLSKEAISLYFQLTYIPAPYTIYETIHKLEPNHYLEINCNSFEVKDNEIKQNKEQIKYKNLNFKEAQKITHDLVQNSVHSRAVSDVPIGTFLSGGVDSSIVSLCLSQYSKTPIDTFSMGFEKKAFDETDKSKQVAKIIGSRHHEFIVSENNLRDHIDNVLLNFDEPFADSSSLPTYLVSRLTQKHVKVALTGDGGDEVFGGYNKYYMGKLNQKYTSMIPEKAHSLVTNVIKNILNTKDDNRGLRFKLNRFLTAVNYSNNFYYNIISLGFQKEELEQLITHNNLIKNSLDIFKNESMSSLNDFRNLDRKLSLEGDMLVKVDRSSMYTSIECRAPFLNKELWNFTNQVPEDYLMRGWNKKFLLKESFKQYFPKGFLDKSKQGFGVPVGDWLRLSLKNELIGYIDLVLLDKQKIFNSFYVRSIVLDHIEGRIDNTFKVWTFFCFQKWYVNQFERIT